MRGTRQRELSLRRACMQKGEGGRRRVWSGCGQGREGRLGLEAGVSQ